MSRRGRRGSGPHPVGVPPSCPLARLPLLSIDGNPQPSDTLLSSSMLSSSNAPPTTMFGTSFQQSSAYSSEQRRRGEEDHIHPPSSYFLLIVVFVAVKDIIAVVDNSLPSHSFARLHAVLPSPLPPP